ncbi:MAG: PAS domain-containing protein [Parvibaculum sp.]
MPAMRGSVRHKSIALPPIDIDPDLACIAPRVQKGLAYWRDKAAGRAMPLRSDIKPEEIASLLPSICLFELRRSSGGFEMFPRLAGSRFEEVFGPIHNKPLATMLAPEIVERWLGAARAVVEVRAPLRLTGKVLHDDKTYIRFELVLAPLSTEGEEIDMLYLVSHFETALPQA